MMQHRQNKGFTLIELLITMLIGLIIMAGMTSVFISQTRTATMLKNKTEAMSDSFLVSQIMQSELRSAKQVCWDAGGNTLWYQPLDSNASILPCGSPASKTKNGRFTYETYKINNITAKDWRMMWKRPVSLMATGTGKNASELVRGLIPKGWISPQAGGAMNGLAVKVIAPPAVVPPPATPLPKTYEVTLKSFFRGQSNQVQPLTLTFKVWARN